jgi:hypothetical protein
MYAAALLSRGGLSRNIPSAALHLMHSVPLTSPVLWLWSSTRVMPVRLHIQHDLSRRRGTSVFLTPASHIWCPREPLCSLTATLQTRRPAFTLARTRPHLAHTTVPSLPASSIRCAHLAICLGVFFCPHVPLQEAVSRGHQKGRKQEHREAPQEEQAQEQE